MALAARNDSPLIAAPNASSFLELYAFEQPAPAKPVDDFVAELKGLVRAHPIDAQLAEALKYGNASREAMQRWIKEYYQFIRLDAQGTAAMIARCRRRGLFLALSQLVNRKTGFHQVTTPPLQLFVRFAAAFGVTPADLEAHYACPETMQAKVTSSARSPAKERCSMSCATSGRGSASVASPST
jgi:pyrroloquinoline quinone (PQQ) biosynthesis protein C